MTNPTQSITAALSAYAQAANSGKVEAPKGEATQGNGFAELVKDAAKSAHATGLKGEVRSMDAINDQADIQEVVTAVAEAELTLQTVVAIRDKVIEAYQDIIRMPI
jgi:flagellar hook-basal body complex protein FliE